MLTIIFSKDRPAQLNALLSSIELYDKETVFDPYVLYTYSSDEFKRGYEKCFEKPINRSIRIKKEKNFRQDLCNILLDNNWCNHQNYIMFLVDDMILRKEIPFIWEEAEQILDRPSMSCLSLRLGKNITWQYQKDQPTPQPNFVEEEKFLAWNRNTIPYPLYFNYPISVDGHIFKSRFIISLIKQTQFTQPNTFEGNLQKLVRRCPPMIACPRESLFINNTINRVQDLYPNKVGETISCSPKELNEKYLEGWEIDFNEMDFSKTVGAHQEYEIKWKI